MADTNEMTHKILEALTAKSYEVLHEFDADTERAFSVNTELLMRIINDSKDSEYGRKYGFASIHDADEYRRRVPFTTYLDYEGYIDRMINGGEDNLLTSYPIVYYAQTSGTSGKPKYVPVSDRGLDVFRRYAGNMYRAVLSEFFRDTRLKDFPDGLMLPVMTLANSPLPNGKRYGSISASAPGGDNEAMKQYLLGVPDELLTCNESADMKYLFAFFGLSERRINLLGSPYIPVLLDLMSYIRDNWRMLTDDIRRGELGRNVIMPGSLREKLSARIQPDPERAAELEREFERGFDQTIMTRIWPNLSGISAIWGGTLSSYARKLQEFSGRSVPYYTIAYAASEGVFAAARHPYDQYYVMVPGSCFFEFIPVSSCDDENPSTVLIDGVQDGKDYELVITNQSGLYRYRTGDVIRVIGFYNESPMVVFKRRMKAVISIASERVMEDSLLSAMREFESRTGIDVIDFCVYADKTKAPGKYVFMIEPDEHVPASRREECARIIDDELRKADYDYRLFTSDSTNRSIDIPEVRFLQPQTFQLFRELRMYKTGITENQLKTIRFLNTPELVKFFTGLEDKPQDSRVP